jgi:hypothetical protein
MLALGTTGRTGYQLMMKLASATDEASTFSAIEDAIPWRSSSASRCRCGGYLCFFFSGRDDQSFLWCSGASSAHWEAPSAPSAVLPSHIHISTGRNSALTNHHALVVRLSPLDLQALLQECHSEKGWAQLLQVLVQIPPEDEQDRSRATDDDALAVEQSILAFVTPTRKRKECCREATIPSCKLGEPREKGPPSYDLLFLQ